MKEKYVVYYKGSGKSLYESTELDNAERFVNQMEKQNVWNNNPYEEKYEIVKIKGRIS